MVKGYSFVADRPRLWYPLSLRGLLGMKNIAICARRKSIVVMRSATEAKGETPLHRATHTLRDRARHRVVALPLTAEVDSPRVGFR
jgi:hypothetical protein